jgi:hypothetical protein
MAALNPGRIAPDYQSEGQAGNADDIGEIGGQIVRHQRSSPTDRVPMPGGWTMSCAVADRDVELIDLKDYPLPLFAEAASPAYAPPKNEVAQRWQKKVAEFDAYIFTVAEYNRGPTAMLKNALDYSFNEWTNKPVSFGAMAASAARGRSSNCG